MLDKSHFSARSLLTWAALVLAASLLSACTPAEPVLPGDELPTVAPLFASDEEALDAAVEVYREYLFVSDLIMQDGGANPERIEPYASGQALEYSLAGFEEFRNANARSTGFYEYKASLLQQVVVTEVATNVHFYTCVYIGDSMIVNQSGTPIHTGEKPSTLSDVVVVSFDSKVGTLTQIDIWLETDICNAIL